MISPTETAGPLDIVDKLLLTWVQRCDEKQTIYRSLPFLSETILPVNFEGKDQFWYGNQPRHGTSPVLKTEPFFGSFFSTKNYPASSMITTSIGRTGCEKISMSGCMNGCSPTLVEKPLETLIKTFNWQSNFKYGLFWMVYVHILASNQFFFLQKMVKSTKKNLVFSKLRREIWD